MWIIFRLCLIVVFAIFKLVYRKSVKGDRFDASGIDLYVHHVKAKKHVRKTQVTFETSCTRAFHLVPESMFFDLLKLAGWNAEIQTGDVAFDTYFYVASDDPTFLRSLRLDGDLRLAFETLAKNGWEKIRCENGIFLIEHEGEELPRGEVVTALRKIKTSIESLSPTSASGDPYLRRIVALEIVLWGGLGYCAGTFVNLQLDRGKELLEPWPLISSGLVVSAGLFVAWFALLLATTRKSSRAPLLIVESFIGLVIGLAVMGPQSMMDLNKMLDRSQPTLHLGRVVSKNQVVKGSGKRRTTHYYLHLEGNYPIEIGSRLEVGSSDYWRFNPPQEMTIVTHEGYFGARYIADLLPGTYSPNPPVQATRAESEATPAKSPARLASEAMMFQPVRIVGGKYFKKRGPGGGVEFEGYKQWGKLVGDGAYFHPNGKLQMRVNFVDGKKNDRYQVFRADGTLEGDFTMKDDKPHGWMRWFDSNGNPEREEIYYEGELLKLTDEEKEKLRGRGPAL